MSAKSSLRARKRAIIRSALQEHALRLFLAKGYDNTTVEEIATAAGVSHMTFFRYFPTKEAVVFSDEYDPLIARLIHARPAREPVIEKLRNALLQGLRLVYETHRDLLLDRTRLVLGTPALRARLWEQQHATQRLLADALASDGEEGSPLPGTVDDLHSRVVVAVCLAAVTAAIEIWAEDNGKHDLPDLIDQALTVLEHELSSSHV